MAVWSLPAPLQRLAAQPVTVPTMTPPAFQNTDLDPYIQGASGSQSLASWEYLMQQGRYALLTGWEAQVDQQIAAHVAGVNHADNFNSVAEYQEYLRNELQLQSQDAKLGWELQADAIIEAERTAFLSALSDRQMREAIQASDQAVGQGQSTASNVTPSNVNPTDAELERQRASWNDEFRGDIQNGFQQFQQALGAVQAQYEQILAQIATKDQEFAGNLQQIDAYEQRVRDGLTNAVASLEGQLSGNDFFYEETCDAQNKCTVDRNAMNAAGAELQTLLATLRQGLQNDTPLSTLSLSMVDYLQRRQSEAQVTQQYWQGITRGTMAYDQLVYTGAPDPGTARPNPVYCATTTTTTNASTHLATVNSSNCSHQNNGINPAGLLGRSDINAVINHTNSGDTTGITSLFSEFRNIESINATEIYGTTGLFDGQVYAGPPPGAPNGTCCGTHTLHKYDVRSSQGSYRTEGISVFYYDQSLEYNSQINWKNGKSTFEAKYKTRWTRTVTESILRVVINYDWHDPNAENNANIWQGYSNNLDTTLTQWRDVLLPAIQNWEAQVATYKADYTAWQVSANTKLAQAQAAAQDGQEALIGSRNRWLSQVEAAYRKDTGDWRQISSNFANEREQLLANARQAAPDISEAFLQRGYRFVPDTGNLQTFAEGLDQSLKGALNFAVADTLSDQAAQAREDSIRIISESLNPYTDEERAGLVGTEIGELANLEAEYREQLQKAPRGAQPKPGKRLQELREKDGRAESANRLRFDVSVSGSGDITATRQIATGAVRHARGDGTNVDDYDAYTRAQEVKIAAPQAVQLVETGDLFSEWQTGDVVNSFYSNLNEGQQRFQKQMAIVSDRLGEANEEAAFWQNRFYKTAQDAAEQAQFQKSVVESALQSIALGMAPHLALRNAMQSELRGRVAGMFEDITGIPAGFISGLLGGSSVKQALAGYAEGVFWKNFQQTHDLPPDVTNLFRTWVSSEMQKANFRKDRREAARFKPEDMILMTSGLGALTYAWRNQAYHDDLQKGMMVAETTAGILLNTVGNIFGGAGTAIWTAYNTAKQAYIGSLNGGSRGAVAGFYSGAINGVLSPYGANVNFSYTYADGFSGSVGAGLPLGENGAAGNLGLSLSFDESGATGGGVGYRNGAVAVGMNYHRDAGLSAFGGLSTQDGDRSFGLGVSEQRGFEAYAQQGSMERGAGRITFSERDGFGVGVRTQYFDASHSQHGGTNASANYRFGKESPFAGTSAGVSYNSNTGFSVNASFSGGGYSANYSIGEGGAITSSLSRNNNPSQYIISSLDQLRSTVDSIAQQRQERVFLAGKRDTLDRARLLDGQGAISDAEFAALVANPEAFSAELKKAGKTLEAAGLGDLVASGQSNEDAGDTIWNGVGDFLSGVFQGELSDKDGYIDPVTGVYRQRTCFVAGTLVRMKDGTGENGGNYKRIEDVKAGDLVMSWNEKTGEISTKPVTDTFVREAPEIYQITLENGEVIETTWSHPFYVEDKGWVKAKELRTGDILKTGNKALTIASIFVPYNETTVFNFTVDVYHTYYVSRSEVLVHNYDIDSLWGDIMAQEEFFSPGGGGMATAAHDAMSECLGNIGSCTISYYAMLLDVYLIMGGPVGSEIALVGIVGKTAAGRLALAKLANASPEFLVMLRKIIHYTDLKLEIKNNNVSIGIEVGPKIGINGSIEVEVNPDGSLQPEVGASVSPDGKTNIGISSGGDVQIGNGTDINSALD
ncbi:MAG: TIGR04388 family protein [bacterium]|nr:TIGR04388 family protein [bacterium]